MKDDEIRSLARMAIDAWGELENDQTGQRKALESWIFVMFRPHIPNEKHIDSPSVED